MPTIAIIGAGPQLAWALIARTQAKLHNMVPQLEADGIKSSGIPR